jgi:hypothetical protein
LAARHGLNQKTVAKWRKRAFINDAPMGPKTPRRAGGPIETPTLAGQREEYLLAQLQAYAKGERHNDVYTRMRGIAAKLKPDEMARIARYYSGLR